MRRACSGSLTASTSCGPAGRRRAPSRPRSRPRTYPLAPNGRRTARFPTLLGNIITEFEEYPTRKYDADGVFYWPRVWWKLPKEVREALDDTQAMVDGALYVSAILYALAPLCLVYALASRAFTPPLVRNATAGELVLLAVAGPICGYALYRLSLPAHRQFGEQVKAMFDWSTSWPGGRASTG